MKDLLTVNRLCVGYGKIKAVADATFALKPGEILGIVGESGCGKSTLLKAIMNQRELGIRILGGSVVFDGRDIEDLSVGEMRELRGTKIGMIFQNPETTFNTIRKYRSQFYDTLKSHDRYRKNEAEGQILTILERLNLDDGKRIIDSCPYEMSGGMNQRVAVAMAMLMGPKLLLADEPTSALDVTVQKQVVEELLRLRDSFGTAIILVTHNIGVVRRMADQIAIMYAGRIVEQGPCGEVLKNPDHPYTRALLNAVPKLNGAMPKGLDGRPPTDGASMKTCAFAERCPLRHKDCENSSNALLMVGENHFCSCTRGNWISKEQIDE